MDRAWVAIIISVVALGASIGQWFLNGPWVALRSRSGIVMGQPVHPEVVMLIAHNRGRGAAWIQQWGWLIRGTLHGPGGWTDGPALPYRLDGNAEVSWMLDYKEAQQNLTQNFPQTKHYWDLVPFVRLGSSPRFRTGRTTMRIWEAGHFGPDPATSQWWRRFSPWHMAATNRHGTGWIKRPRLP